MAIINGVAYENLTFYELTPKGEISNKIEELGQEVGAVSIPVDMVLDLDKAEQILPADVMEAAHEYPQLFRFLSYIAASAITDPKNFNGAAVRSYKTKDYAQALLLAELVSGWLGGAYIIVEKQNRLERYAQMRSPVYYVWSKGRGYYIDSDSAVKRNKQQCQKRS